MNKPKLHHYVPQFHMKRFADSEGKIWVWERDLDRAFTTSSRAIAAETHFYRLTQYEKLGHDPSAMEKQFAEIESDVFQITDQWLDWLRTISPLEKIEIPEINREIVSRHIALQHLRTATTRNLLVAFAEANSKSLLNSDQRREFHTGTLWNLPLVEGLTQKIYDSIWLFARNTTATPFVTSDNPVAFRTSDNRQWIKMDMLGDDTYIVFALSPDIVMYCYPKTKKWRVIEKFGDSLSPVTLTDEMVESENSGQVFMAWRFIISNRNSFQSERQFAPSIGTDVYAEKPS
jgi:Protein of unknown function (DUF4238)